MTDRFPEVLPALAAVPAGTVLDGEVCAVSDGHFDFHALAMPPRARAAAGVAVSFQAFDVFSLGGRDVRSAPLAERWGDLLALLKHSPPALQPVLSTLEPSAGNVRRTWQALDRADDAVELLGEEEAPPWP